MSEFGPEGGPSSAEQKRTLPERFNHEGTKFESPEQANQLSLLQMNLADEGGRKASVFDALAVVKCELDDVKEQKTYVIGGRDLLKPTERKLNVVLDTVAKAAVGQFSDITMAEHAITSKYLDNQITRWEVAAANEDATAPQREEAAKNIKIFEDIRAAVFPSAEDAEKVRNEALALDGDTDEIEKFANTHESGNLERVDQEILPEYVYDPNKITLVLEQLRGKNDITFEDIQLFYEAALDDMKDQGDKKHQEYEAWTKAIGAATHFLSKHSEDADDPDKFIKVAVLPDTRIDVGFDLSAKHPHGTQFYSFNTSFSIEDPDSIGTHSYASVQYEAREKDLNLAIATLPKLSEKDADFLEDVATAEPNASEAMIALTRALENHKTYINSKDEFNSDDEKDNETLLAMRKKIMESAGMKIEEDKPQGDYLALLNL